MKRSERDVPVTLSPWIPETRPVVNAGLGKLQEELGELVGIVGRCQVQGVDGCEPETGERNELKLEKEIADVQAAMDVLVEMLGLNTGAIHRRRLHKIEHLTAWHSLITKGATNGRDAQGT